jgi:SulP family sulfate permease
MEQPVTPRPAPRVVLQDIIAGISVALFLIPQGLAYAELAGLPPYLGLYASAIPPLAAAFFVSSPYLQTGPTAITSILTGGALVALAVPRSHEYVLLASLLALIVGVIRVGIGLVRAGKIAYLMSEPVLRGFTTAAALLIVLSQIPVVLGLDRPPTPRAIATIGWLFSHMGDWQFETIVIAAASFVITGGSARLHPLIPGVLIATAGGIAYSLATGYAGSVVGEIPAVIPTPSLGLPWTQLPRLVLPGVVIALVGFSEAASIARVFAARERQRWVPDKDFISQGVANLAAGLSGGFPVGASFSRSGLVHLLGARSRWSGAFTGLAVLAFIPLASILAPLPTAVLGAIVIAAVMPLVNFGEILDLWRLSKPQFLVATATFLLTLLLSPRIDEGVVLGIGFAIAVHLWREFRVKLTAWTEDGAVHVRPEGVLWFGSAQMLETQVLDLLAENKGARRLVLHMERLGRVDLTASLVLATLVRETRAAGMETEIVAIHPTTAKALRRVLREARASERTDGAASQPP